MLTMATTIRQFWKDLNCLMEVYNANESFIDKSLERSLKIILSNSDLNHNFRLALEAVLKDVESGLSFYKSLLKNPRFFGSVEINLVKAGELCGMLDVILTYLTQDRTPTKADEYQNFYASLAICMTSGVPILSSLEIAKGYCTGELAEAVDKLHNSIKDGDCFSVPMDQSGLFCGGEVAMIDIGEQAGVLDNVLLRLAEMCRK